MASMASKGVSAALIALFIVLVLAPTAGAKPKFKVLANVPGGLWSGLTFDAKGNLYGVTLGGGGYGSVFELSRKANGKWMVTTLHSFDGTDGTAPNGNLSFDAEGDLYGTTLEGGAYVGGTVFELSPGSGGWTFSVLYNFCPQYNCPDGYGPGDGLVLDKAGNLYGTAGGGGAYDYGVAYELTPGSGGWTYSVLYDFGSKPYDSTASTAPMIFSKAGDLYDTSNAGGRYHGGTVFKLTQEPGGWEEHQLYSFCSKGGYLCKDGVGPQGGVVFGADGSLYGTTSGGGSQTCYGYACGTIFRLRRTRDGCWKESVLYDFAKPANGFAPVAGVVSDRAGNLYGTTAVGGTGRCTNGCGVVYKLSPCGHGKWTYTVLHKFDGADGGLPDGGVIRDERGNLYGVAYSTVFEITP